MELAFTEGRLLLKACSCPSMFKESCTWRLRMIQVTALLPERLCTHLGAQDQLQPDANAYAAPMHMFPCLLHVLFMHSTSV